jgi:hypothetical protein
MSCIEVEWCIEIIKTKRSVIETKKGSDVLIVLRRIILYSRNLNEINNNPSSVIPMHTNQWPPAYLMINPAAKSVFVSVSAQQGMVTAGYNSRRS